MQTQMQLQMIRLGKHEIIQRGNRIQIKILIMENTRKYANDPYDYNNQNVLYIPMLLWVRKKTFVPLGPLLYQISPNFNRGSNENNMFGLFESHYFHNESGG